MFRFSAEAAYLLLVAHGMELIGDGAPSRDKALNPLLSQTSRCANDYTKKQ